MNKRNTQQRIHHPSIFEKHMHIQIGYKNVFEYLFNLSLSVHSRWDYFILSPFNYMAASLIFMSFQIIFFIFPNIWAKLKKMIGVLM